MIMRAITFLKHPELYLLYKFSNLLFLTNMNIIWRHMGEWMYSFTILDLDIRWRRVVSFTSRPLYSRGRIPGYGLDRRLGLRKSRSWSYGEKKISCPLPGIEYRPSNSKSVAMLSCPGSYTNNIIILKQLYRSWVFCSWLDTYGSERSIVIGYWKYDGWSWDGQTEKEFLSHVSDYKFLKKDAAAWSVTGLSVCIVADASSGFRSGCVLYRSESHYRFSQRAP
jgi:hypothetical protein